MTAPVVNEEQFNTESIVLGVTLFETDAIRPHLGRLSFEMFYRPVHRILARLALDDIAEHGTPDYRTIGTRAVEAAGLAPADVRKLLEDLTEFASFCDPVRIERAIARLEGLHRDTCLKGVLTEVNLAVDQGQITTEEAVARIETTEDALATPRAQAALVWQPFPTHALPPILGRFVHESALALGTDAAFVAMPVLAATAAMIGTTRRIRLRSTWCEPAILWCVVAARSGTMKSPAHDLALAPIRGLERRAFDQHDQALLEHEQANMRYERDLSLWRKNRSIGDPPQKPRRPGCIRYTVNDTTIEALAPILLENPRGLLLARDELSGWFSSHAQYKGGKGDDEARWLELHRAGMLIVDRKSGNPQTIRIARAAASICGTIQPEVLRRALTVDRFASGMAARLLLVAPPEQKKTWVTPDLPATTEQNYSRLLVALSALRHVEDDGGALAPVDIPLHPDAGVLFEGFYERHAERQLLAASDAEAAALAKLEGYAARFGLIFHVCRAVSGHTPEGQIDAASMQGGIDLAEWFIHETRRIYTKLGGAGQSRFNEPSRLVSLIYSKGGHMTPRELRRADRRFRDKGKEAENALSDLAHRGFGHMVTASSGGRPATTFHLAGAASTKGESSATPEEKGTFVDSAPVGKPGDWGAVP